MTPCPFTVCSSELERLKETNYSKRKNAGTYHGVRYHACSKSGYEDRILDQMSEPSEPVTHREEAY